ncbi:hypothetical protein BGX38DRAFT_1139907 [Terfezia claveryi]|nr:hypothetical protein BGX38DRAFT_1139907 [Terfezia claveryi]
MVPQAAAAAAAAAVVVDPSTEEAGALDAEGQGLEGVDANFLYSTFVYRRGGKGCVMEERGGGARKEEVRRGGSTQRAAMDGFARRDAVNRMGHLKEGFRFLVLADCGYEAFADRRREEDGPTGNAVERKEPPRSKKNATSGQSSSPDAAFSIVSLVPAGALSVRV